MKKLILPLLFVATISQAQNEITVNSKVGQATVFLNGAELTHTAETSVDKGMSDIIFTDLAENIDQNSIQVSGKGNATILAVNKRFNYLKKTEKPARIKELEDSLKLLKERLEDKQADKEVLNEEMSLLLSNKQIGGEEGTLTVQQLKSMADFFKERIGNIKKEILQVDRELAEIEKRITEIRNQLNEFNKDRKERVNEVIVQVSADRSTELDLTLTYLTQSAGWQPFYNIRVADINSNADLEYNANVRQSTGISWKDCQLVLSTRNPRENNNKPELNTWFIDFMQPPPSPERVGKRNFQTQQMAMESAADMVTVRQKMLSVEFTPSVEYTIPSDNKEHTIAIQNYNLPAEYEYYTAPRQNKAAFLTAKLSDWKDYNLLRGSANVYFQNSYVGETRINPNVAKKELTLSLGKDKNILVERELLDDFTEDKFLSSDVERKFAYEIKIRNNKNSAVQLTIEDQIPISKNEDIEVELIDKSGAELNKENGILTWKVELNPNGTVTKRFTYSIRYPKDKQVNF
jgi:uncharacterized protein (TIGR02231 family)